MHEIDKAYIRLLFQWKKNKEALSYYCEKGNKSERAISRFLLALDGKQKSSENVEFITVNGKHIPIDKETGKSKIKGMDFTYSEENSSESVDKTKKEDYKKKGKLQDFLTVHLETPYFFLETNMQWSCTS